VQKQDLEPVRALLQQALTINLDVKPGVGGWSPVMQRRAQMAPVAHHDQLFLRSVRPGTRS